MKHRLLICVFIFFACLTVLGQVNQVWWSKGKVLHVNPVAEIDSVTFGQFVNADTFLIVIDRASRRIVYDTVDVHVPGMVFHDTIYTTHTVYLEPSRRIGVFSVAKDRQVSFSQGNLQYIQNQNIWKFADQQYEYIGAGNIKDGKLANKIDLFGWSGDNTTAPFGVSTSTNAADYAGAFVDWGVNEINGEAPNTWRTLSKDEWEYLITGRENASALYGVANVAGVNGLIILPDNWVLPEGLTFQSGFANGDGDLYFKQHQIFTEQQWLLLETAGAIFLPAAGIIWPPNTIVAPSLGAHYQSSTRLGDDSNYWFGFRSSYYTIQSQEGCVLRSVRLVHDTIVPPPAPCRTIEVNGVKFNMMCVEGGTFMMGAADDEVNVDADEKPQHQVTVSDYMIGQTEVTQELWTAVMGSNPSKTKGDKLPVEQISWAECQEFISKLNKLTGLYFRLPTEAEWEFAARGGNRSRGFVYAGSDDIDEVAWTPENSENKTHNVGEKKPNELGIYDMSGNVYERCSDWYASYSAEPQINPQGPSSSTTYRVSRGGCAMKQNVSNEHFGAYYCRILNRGYDRLTTKSSIVGLRLVLDTHQYVDLGLSVMWATTNVGATAPEEYGDYFAWGETEPKEVYDWSTYKWCDGTEDNMTKYNATDGLKTLQPEDDAAHVNWGGEWRMPTDAELQELIDNCTWEWVEINGTEGYYVTSNINNNHIFISAGGYKIGDGTSAINRNCQYWSNTLCNDLHAFVYHAYKSGSHVRKCTGSNRSAGQSVRPVLPADREILTPATPSKRIGVFSVAGEKRVSFSQGNLQYVQYRDEWRFAENQYDYIGEDNMMDGMLAERIDLFGWSANNTTAPFGVSTSTNNADYAGEFVDWGVNEIQGEAAGEWRTLSNSEWEYLLNGRSKAKQLRFFAHVNDVKGFVFLPDNWICPDGIELEQEEIKVLSIEQWNVMEEAGAIFLPAAGRRQQTNLINLNDHGNYWSSTRYNDKYADYLAFTFSTKQLYVDHVLEINLGRSVRLVHDTVVPEAVDLGLSVMWATFNVGAKAPEQSGYFFAWGETQPKTKYAWNTYKWSKGTLKDLTKYCTNTDYGQVDNKSQLDPEDDAATVHWDKDWRMPTKEEWEELRTGCTWEQITINGILGYKVSGKKEGYTDRSIFLPAAGYRSSSSNSGVNKTGYYLSSSLYTGDPSDAWRFHHNATSRSMSHSSNRSTGFTVRPVTGARAKVPPTVETIEATQVTGYSALLGGKVTSSGGADVTEFGIVCSLSSNPTIDDEKLVNDQGMGLFFSVVDGLQDNTTYYVRAYAINEYGIAYGPEVSFTTGAFTPEDTTGVDDGHAYVDLGLSVLWATCNIGASTPEAYGDYFAWGETTPKNVYKWDTYSWSNSDGTIFTKYNTDSSMGSIDNKTTLDTEDDAATQCWGENWRTPTYAELTELRTECIWVWTTMNGVKGHRVTSKVNGNSIFLPAAGYKTNKTLSNAGHAGYYESSSLYPVNSKQGYYIHYRTSYVTGSNISRQYGLTIRPVLGKHFVKKPSVTTIEVTNITNQSALVSGRVTNDGGANIIEHGVVYSTKKSPTIANDKVVSHDDLNKFYCNLTGLQEETTYYVRAYATNEAGTTYGAQKIFKTVDPTISNASGQENGYGYVDLGLSVMWAECNVGANTPFVAGDYFAWGETAKKDLYSWTTYQLCNPEDSLLTKYCVSSKYGIVDNRVVLDSLDDVATVSRNGGWRMPTNEEWTELRENCTWYWTYINNINGYKVVGKNGNSIFIPATGYLSNTDAYNVGSAGTYWSSSLYVDFSQYALGVLFDAAHVDQYFNGRFCGQPVRPVCEPTAPAPPAKRIGVFSVAKDKQVSFSQGNLQYTQSKNQWRFAENQYDYLGEDNVKDGILADKIDLFGWSANNTTAPYGISTSTNNADYAGEFVDWGANVIGDDVANTWRTLSKEEWDYIVKGRRNAEQLHSKCCINNVKGLLLLPDDWVSIEGIAIEKVADADTLPSDVNVFMSEQWKQMEAAGAVFLPAAGSHIKPTIKHTNHFGGYCSSTKKDVNNSYILAFHVCPTSYTEYSNNKYGRSVRLVRDTIVPPPAPCRTIEVNGVTFNMMCVEGGTFMMGEGRSDAHQVTLSDYYIGETEVTQRLWKAVMGSIPDGQEYEGDEYPVAFVSLADCRVFVERLSQLTGRYFRIPTEAEWEYAARGGKHSKGYTYAGSDSIGEVAWYKDNMTEYQPHAVKQLKPNELGTYDMTGNLAEWVSDWYAPYNKYPQTNPTGAAEPAELGYRNNYRGGCWTFTKDKCESTFRHRFTNRGANGIGFRLAMSDEEPFRAVYLNDTTRFYLRPVKKGTFMMGAADDDTNAEADEKPQHEVTLSDYYIGQTEVTQQLWQAVMGYNPSSFKGDNLPVESVSWDECQQFVEKLSEMTGLYFRLPTEAEWEYAARGGNRSKGYVYSGSNNADSVAWHENNSINNATNQVGILMPNELEIYDMSGNVYEFCQDLYAPYTAESQINPQGPTTTSKQHRVCRGGAFLRPGGTNRKNLCCVTDRGQAFEDVRYRHGGLRIVLDERPVPPPAPEYVDLGLSVKWATFNVGATAPEEYGDYFAWGEVEPKEKYDWTTYLYCKGTSTTMTKYCGDSSFGYNGFTDNKTVLEPEDDAAYVNWGGAWRMPTDAEMTELREKCTWTWTTQNGVNGYKVVGPNGNSIFLPTAGYIINSSLFAAGSYGYYWSSSLNTSSPSCAYSVVFIPSSMGRRDYDYRYRGRSVRPVCP